MKLSHGTVGRKSSSVGEMEKSTSNGWMESVTDTGQWNPGCLAIAAETS